MMKGKLLNLSLMALLTAGFNIFTLSGQDLLRQIQTAVGMQPTEQPTRQAEQYSVSPKVSPAVRAQKRIEFWNTVIRGHHCIGLSDDSDDMRKSRKYLRRAEHEAATGMPYRKPGYIARKKPKAPRAQPSPTPAKKRAPKKTAKQPQAKKTKAEAARKKREAAKK